MELLPRILTMLTTPWIAWFIFGMFLLLIVNEWLQPGFVVASFRLAFTNHNRLFGDQSPTIGSQLCTIAYQVMIFTFILYLCNTTPQAFNGIYFLQIALLVIGYLLVQKVGYWIVSYTFDLHQFTPNMHLFASLRQSLALIFFPISLLMMYIGNAPWLQVCILALVGAYWLMLFIKTTRTFWNSFMSLPYILLYLFTLEIIPISMVITGAYYIY